MPKAPPRFRPKRQTKAKAFYDKKLQQKNDKQRGSSHQRGYDAKWRKEREVFLNNNPLCVHCLSKGISTAANEVDHIIPHKGDYDLFWDQENWQALCKSCHSRKTAIEDSGFARQRTLL